MKLWTIQELPKLPKMNLAVVGHVEWVTFLAVDQLPKAGTICHSTKYFEEPAGGGAVAAVQLTRLIGEPVHLITALGKDSIGEKSYQRLEQLGLKLSVAWREKPTRRGISMIDSQGERAITVIGERLQPLGNDQLPWKELVNYEGIFVTATDANGLQNCRNSKVLAATPRLKLSTIEEANVRVDALIGSGLDPGEQITTKDKFPSPKIRISTEGALGGQVWPGGRYAPVQLKTPVVDAYGCGDSFAAGVTAGLSAGWSLEQAISLGSHCGASCATHFGPYPKG